jgi:hypothetical protein
MNPISHPSKYCEYYIHFNAAAATHIKVQWKLLHKKLK